MLLLENKWYYRNFQKQNYFTKNDIIKMFLDEGYVGGYFYAFPKEMTVEEQKIFESLARICEDSKNDYYSFRFQKK